MKNKIFALALIAVSLVSCTKDDVNPTKDLKPKAAEFASVTVDLKTENGASATGKSVNRGDLHAWISEIDVNVHSNDFTYSDIMTPFQLVASGGDTAYNLDAVALGSNNFTVTTKTSTAIGNAQFEQTTVAPDARITQQKTKAIYALYGATINGFNVIKGANTIPSTMLTTQHGRAIGVFTLSQALKDLGVTAKVKLAQSMNVVSGNYEVMVGIIGETNKNASFYWSNDKSTAGKPASFSIDLIDINNHVFKTLTVNMEIVASTSVNNIYTINQNDITTNTASEVFTAQPWVNQDGNVTVE